MDKYKVLILGSKINDLKQSRSIFQLLSYYIFLGFNKIKNVKAYYYDKESEELPLVDFIIVISYSSINIDLNHLKEKTKAIKICSLRENYSSYDFDFTFNLDRNNDRSYGFPPPCSKEILKPSKKESKTILIDHYWENYLKTDRDWTETIENWIEERYSEYKIYRLIRFNNEKNNIKSFEIPIFYSDYLSYLESTSHIETFIITHYESYSYGVIDMVARGTRVFSPPGFIPKYLLETFNIPVFKNKDNFFRLLDEPIDKKNLNSKIDSCIDYFDISKEIDVFFRQWMENKDVDK